MRPQLRSCLWGDKITATRHSASTTEGLENNKFVFMMDMTRLLQAISEQVMSELKLSS
jgi:hypothetical protein